MFIIPKDRCVAVLIDIQERLFPHIAGHEELQRILVKLIKGLHILDVPCVVTQQYTRGLGTTIAPVAHALGEFSPLEKLTFSCCGDPDFLSVLGTVGRNCVIVAGIEAHVCVLQTVLDLLDRGYQPVVVEDAVSSRKLNDKHVAVERMRGAGAVITTCESILFELCRVSGTEKFKAISQLVK